MAGYPVQAMMRRQFLSQITGGGPSQQLKVVSYSSAQRDTQSPQWAPALSR